MIKRPQGFAEFVRRRGYHAVYVVTPPDERPSKVGIGNDPRKRFGAIQGANWQDLKLYRYWWLAGRPLTSRVEAACLKKFSDLRIRGEWLDIKAAALAKQIMLEIADLGLVWWSDADIERQRKRAADKEFERMFK